MPAATNPALLAEFAGLAMHAIVLRRYPTEDKLLKLSEALAVRETIAMEAFGVAEAMIYEYERFLGAPPAPAPLPAEDARLDKAVAELGWFSLRTVKALEAQGISTLRQLLQRNLTDLYKLNGLGLAATLQIAERLAHEKLHLASLLSAPAAPALPPTPPDGMTAGATDVGG